MNIINRIRLYHATLASLSLLAYITGDLGIFHAWLGYGVSIIIALRLLWALSGERQVGLTRFYPSFEGLKLGNAFTHPAISKTFMMGIAISLLLVTSTGIMMDKGRAIGLADTKIAASAYTNDDERSEDRHGKKSFLAETHEFVANILLLFVGMHVTYLLLFKRPLALFMLFIPKQIRKEE